MSIYLYMLLEDIKEIEENGLYYYVVPKDYPLFKATKNYDATKNGLFLDPNGFYFFGIKDMDPVYIESYEDEYGIIFEFITKREYKLLALDKRETQENLYREAPLNIKNILEKNYGYNTNGLRNSESNPDRELAQYLCKKGYGGYAIKQMETDFKGTFHPELMFCDIRGIEYIGKITSDKRMDQILESAKLKTLSTQIKTSRKQNRTTHSSDYKNPRQSQGKRLFLDYDSEDSSPSKRLFGDDDDDIINKQPGKRLFGDDDDDDKMFTGGIHKKRKPRKSVSRKKTNKKGTNKKGTNKKGTNKKMRRSRKTKRNYSR